MGKMWLTGFIVLGWHVCRTKLPRKIFNFNTKNGTGNEEKDLKNNPKRL